MDINRETMKKIMLLILYTVIVLALAMQFERVLVFIGWIIRLVFPFLCGSAIAFILNVPMRFVETRLPEKRVRKHRRVISLTVALLFVILILGIVFFLVVPQITDTLVSLKDLIPQFFMNVQVMLEKKFGEYPEIVEYINNINLQIDWKDTFEKIAGFVTTGAGTVLSSTLTAAMSIASGIATFGIAFIFAIYILLQKENLARQFKKLFYAYFPERAVNEFIRICRMAEQTFYNSVRTFDVPRDIENVFYDPIIGKRYAGFKSAVHTGAVHPIKKSCHKPADIQVGDLTPTFFFGRIIR